MRRLIVWIYAVCKKPIIIDCDSERVKVTPLTFIKKKKTTTKTHTSPEQDSNLRSARSVGESYTDCAAGAFNLVEILPCMFIVLNNMFIVLNHITFNFLNHMFIVL